MAKAAREQRIPAEPMIAALADQRVKQSEFAKKVEASPQDITNWKARGVPSARLPAVAAALGMTVEQYLARAGRLPAGAKIPQGGIDAAALLQDFEALPPGLRSYVATRAAALRKFYEALPGWLRDKLVPPKDPDQYRMWERDIESLVHRFLKGDHRDP